ncbi:MAG: hypothetical protein HY078_11970 [Elusimicrobia bacterium]|nr:hypothetical protein [Elusimicrobiota bacterium]
MFRELLVAVFAVTAVGSFTSLAAQQAHVRPVTLGVGALSAQGTIGGALNLASPELGLGSLGSGLGLSPTQSLAAPVGISLDLRTELVAAAGLRSASPAPVNLAVVQAATQLNGQPDLVAIRDSAANGKGAEADRSIAHLMDGTDQRARGAGSQAGTVDFPPTGGALRTFLSRSGSRVSAAATFVAVPFAASASQIPPTAGGPWFGNAVFIVGAVAGGLFMLRSLMAEGVNYTPPGTMVGLAGGLLIMAIGAILEGIGF